MPNSAQKTLLDSFIAEDGIYLQPILEYEHVSLGTKLLYLERAITQNCKIFLQSLDKLYNLEGGELVKAANIECIRALKVINDLCFNNEVKYDEFGSARTALTHYFSSLGEINAQAFQTTIKESINEQIFKIGMDHSEEIAAQKNSRITAESAIVKQAGWRIILDLPLQQLTDTVPLLEHGFFQRQYSSRVGEVFLGITSAHVEGPSLASLNRTLIDNPQNSRVRLSRAEFWAGRNDYHALLDFNYILQYWPGHAEARTGRAALYERQDNKELALSDYQYVLELNPYCLLAIEGIERLSIQVEQVMQNTPRPYQPV